MPRRRSYDQYCAAARALDRVGDRWALLIVRELLAGPRRYTDLHADLPGVSTDVLASRLRDMERDDLVTRRKLPPPAAAVVYELTARGAGLLPVLGALAEWGAADLGEPRPTDAVRAHWFALPLLRVLGECAGGEAGTVEVVLDTGRFHLSLGPDHRAPASAAYGDGPAGAEPDARLTLSTAACRALADGGLPLTDAVREGRVAVHGESPLAKVLSGR
ncbi:winged helix-turn-helix transcriptional regulator [Streptomyces montanisoli]|uniref:Helix-turn-helix transcriptional regulator n=1 Tax=Streptomyces montanisoli TaxID=2798581 RepID=A0A940S1A0_9ACTN|nr:helix-turn-helix domain-containing protein [Streptomyces montanisoli]MBP0461754.1 helix-turn-helix transcriptional regulator [Streptomyces montanisoli]